MKDGWHLGNTEKRVGQEWDGSGRGLPPRGKICPGRCGTHALAGRPYARRALGCSSDQQSALAKKRVLQPRNEGLTALDHCAQRPGKGLWVSAALGGAQQPHLHARTDQPSQACYRQCHPKVTRTLRARPAPAGVDSAGHAGPRQGLSPGRPWCPAGWRECEASPGSSGTGSEWKHYHNLITFHQRSLRSPSPQPQCQPCVEPGMSGSGAPAGARGRNQS